jgi:hypothetical protein
MPAAAGLLWHAWRRLVAGRAWRMVFAATAVWSVLANGVGYVYGWGAWCSCPDLDRRPGRLWDWRDNPLACAALGLPDHCPHPLRRGGERYDVDGVEFEVGRGWVIVPEGMIAIAREAELLVDCHGRPVGLLVLTLTGEPGPQPQEVTVCLNGAERDRAELPSGSARAIAVRVRPEERGRLLRLTLHFSNSRRVSALDIVPQAGALVGVQVGLYEK